MIYWLENTIRAVRRYLSRSEWAIRHLHLPVSENTSHEHGLLLIQIDGLSREQMERAMQAGRLPFLKSLAQKQHYKTHTFYSGLPSTTPSVQGELHYGVKCAVPAFSFLERDSRRIATMYKEDWAKKVEERLRSKCDGEPLLKGGSSWSNIYTGGADVGETHYCAANIGPGDLFKRASIFGLIGFFALHFPVFIRLFVLLIVELLLAIRDLVRGVSKGQNFGKECRFLVSRIMICIGLREIVTAGAKIDLARGLPIIHANYLGYDEQSHCRGPGSRYAHWSLRGIDKAIESLYWAAHRSARRDYEVWVFSDHGQEAARSYAEHFEGGIERAIADAINKLHQRPRSSWSRSQQRASRAYWSGVGPKRRLREHSDAELLTKEEEESFAVTAMGPIGNVYFAFELSDEQKHELGRYLIKHSHVPGVLYRTQSGEVLWLHAEGEWKVPDEVHEAFSHSDDLKPEIARDLACLTQNDFAGDLLLLGCNPKGYAWSFPIERGAHGGPGIHETQGFALLPERTRLPHPQKSYLRPGELRAAALHFLGRRSINSKTARRPSEQPLRVMTYNVHGCQGMDGKVSPGRIARVIEMHSPDVVALQEIDLGRARSHGHDQAQMIADRLGMHVVFCPIVVRNDELYGHALLSRSPITVLHSAVFNCGPNFSSCEPRGALLLQIEYNGRQVHVLNTHLGLGPSERLVQVSELLGPNWLGKVSLDEPAIICGDFNMMPGSLPYRAIIQRFRDAQLAGENRRPIKTFPASLPVGRIDHVFVSSQFEALTINVPRNNLTRIASDHLPLIVDLAFRQSVRTPLRKPDSRAFHYAGSATDSAVGNTRS